MGLPLKCTLLAETHGGCYTWQRKRQQDYSYRHRLEPLSKGASVAVELASSLELDNMG
jgi:hypothetical protein